jgi:hypothetical protein
MTDSSMPLLRQAAAWAHRVFCNVPLRFSLIVAIVVAVASSAHAATPFEVRVAGAGPDVLLIPGLTRAIYERQYKTLGGVRIDMSPAGRHFIMLDDPAWFEKTLEAFVP